MTKGIARSLVLIGAELAASIGLAGLVGLHGTAHADVGNIPTKTHRTHSSHSTKGAGIIVAWIWVPVVDRFGNVFYVLEGSGVVRVQMTWTEDERVTTRYVATVNVPEAFAGWDEDTQREYLDDQRCEYGYTGLPGETVDGELVDSEIEGWVVQAPVLCPGCVEQLAYPAQHATLCPAFHEHAAIDIHADFIECRCGHLSVNKVDRQAHIQDVQR